MEIMVLVYNCKLKTNTWGKKLLKDKIFGLQRLRQKKMKGRDYYRNRNKGEMKKMN